MLSGAAISLGSVEVTEEMVSKLASLFDYCLKKKTTTQHPKYVYSAFNCFKQHKTHIQLDLLYAYYKYDKEMRDLIMHSMEKARNKKREEGDFSNLFRAELLQIFPTVKTMTIMAYDLYTFSLSRLFRLISKSALEKVVVRGGTWLTQQTTDQLKQTYQTAGYHINIEYKSDKYDYKYYECVISKKKK